MLQARSYRIIGRVQNVGYRYFAYDAARREGLTGWVCNMPDGSVEAWAEGERDALERFEASLGMGPAGARVHAVDRDMVAVSGQYREFFIKG